MVGYALAVLFALTNAFVHSRDGYTAVYRRPDAFRACRRRSRVDGLVARALTNRHRFGV